MINRKAQSSGIGSLIIFIAMILVAAIAAGVIISTGSNLQSKSLHTGNKAKESVSGGLKLLEVYATDATDGTLENFYIRNQLLSGSKGFDLGETVIMVNTQSNSYTYIYNETVGNCDPSNLSTNVFNVEFTMNGTKKKESPGSFGRYILPGDTIKICINVPEIEEAERMLFLIVPKDGQKLYFETVTPFTFTNKYENLYP